MGEQETNLVGTTLGERYEVLREIGEGSMGSVFEAKHAVLGRRLALKVLKQDCSNPKLKKRFFNEARAAGAITHEHIVQVYDFGIVPDTDEPYIVMEYVEGETLQQYMDAHKAMQLDEVLDVGRQLLTAIEVIHGTGLVHRDIKPSNVMTVTARRPKLFIKLVDFGIAKAVNESWEWPSLTRVDEVLGTPVYLSPEQAMGETADARWDLWAAGIIFYEMLAGKLPFPTQSLAQITSDIIRHNFAPVTEHRPDLPPWLVKVVDRALERDIDDRFPSATDFLQALERGEKGADAAPPIAASSAASGHDDGDDLLTSAPQIEVDTDREVPAYMSDEVEAPVLASPGTGPFPADGDDPDMQAAMDEAQRLLGGSGGGLDSDGGLSMPDDGAKTVLDIPVSAIPGIEEARAAAAAQGGGKGQLDSVPGLSSAQIPAASPSGPLGAPPTGPVPNEAMLATSNIPEQEHQAGGVGKVWWVVGILGVVLVGALGTVIVLLVQ